MANPTWFPCTDLPIAEMKEGDMLFVPQILRGELTKGFIRFSEDEKTVLDYKIEPSTKEELVI